MKKVLSILFVFIFLYAQSQTVIEMRQENGIYTIPCKVNGLKLRFIFDTGASNVSMSLSEILFMLKNDYISKEDIYGVSEAQLANGDIVENTEVLLREIEIGGIVLKDVKANIIHEIAAPLLLGQSAIEKLGPYQIDGSKLVLNNYSSKSENVYEFKDVVESNNLWLLKSTMNPVTGEILEISNGITTQKFTVLKGKKNGDYFSWFNNGNQKEKKTYLNGQLNGKAMKWYDNGQLNYLEDWVENKREGISKGWHENGQVYWEKHTKNNFFVGKYLEIHSNGTIKVNTTLNGCVIVEPNFKKDFGGTEFKHSPAYCLNNEVIEYDDLGNIKKIYENLGNGEIKSSNYNYSEAALQGYESLHDIHVNYIDKYGGFYKYFHWQNTDFYKDNLSRAVVKNKIYIDIKNCRTYEEFSKYLGYYFSTKYVTYFKPEYTNAEKDGFYENKFYKIERIFNPITFEEISNGYWENGKLKIQIIRKYDRDSIRTFNDNKEHTFEEQFEPWINDNSRSKHCSFKLVSKTCFDKFGNVTYCNN